MAFTYKTHIIATVSAITLTFVTLQPALAQLNNPCLTLTNELKQPRNELISLQTISLPHAQKQLDQAKVKYDIASQTLKDWEIANLPTMEAKKQELKKLHDQLFDVRLRIQVTEAEKRRLENLLKSFGVFGMLYGYQLQACNSLTFFQVGNCRAAVMAYRSTVATLNTLKSTERGILKQIPPVKIALEKLEKQLAVLNKEVENASKEYTQAGYNFKGIEDQIQELVRRWQPKALDYRRNSCMPPNYVDPFFPGVGDPGGFPGSPGGIGTGGGRPGGMPGGLGL